MELAQIFGMIEDYAIAARAAVADESESNVRYYTQQIVGLSAQADSIVKGM